MAKDPAFLFYPNDWIGGTMGMSLEEKGAYMEVLMMQFNRGHMTSDMIVHMIGQVWDKIQVKFKKDDDGLWFNERLEEEKEKRKSFVNSRLNNKNGKNQYNKKTGHMTSHMENVNENINKKIKGIKFLENFSKVQLSDGTIQELGEKQKEYVESGDYSPSNIFKGAIF